MLFMLAIMAVGAIVLVPMIAAIGLDPVPGDFTIQTANFRMAVPVTLFAVRKPGSGPFHVPDEAIRAAGISPALQVVSRDKSQDFPRSSVRVR